MKYAIFAHAGETHGGGLEAVTHYAAAWYIALPVFFITVVMICYLAWIVSGKDFGSVLMILAGLLLVSGFTLYSVSALVSGIAIVGGILIAGFLALASLSTDKK